MAAISSNPSTSSLRILADENIPCVGDAFGPLGRLEVLPGRALTADRVREADALLVRSVTRVDAGLLAGSRVGFVGSATAGLDHVDEAWLAARGIAFAAAPGSNAESVAQYVAAVLFEFRRRLGRPLRGLSLGIVGLGHCGGRVERIARALGLQPLRCDPPLARAGAPGPFVPLEALAACDIITLHTPLAREGPDATWRLIDRAFLRRLRPGAALINAARGGIVDETPLREALADGWLAAAALDVWEGEPDISPATLAAVTLATPHVAGYALDAKLRGTEMIYRAFCRRFGIEPRWSAAQVLPPVVRVVRWPAPPADLEAALGTLIKGAYPIARDDAALRRLPRLPPAERPACFDALRRDYPPRREFSATKVLLGPPTAHLAPLLHGLGFTVEPGPSPGTHPEPPI